MKCSMRVHVAAFSLLWCLSVSARTKLDHKKLNSIEAEETLPAQCPVGRKMCRLCEDPDSQVPDMPGESSKERRLMNLIEELSTEQCFETYAHVQQELLQRLEKDKVFEDFTNGDHWSTQAWDAYKSKEDSVFDRVEQHKLNGENKLNLYAEQFLKAHGVDHQTYTEKWLFEETGEDIQLEKVLENPTFEDFTGVYDIKPMTAYVASKMIIDEADFMGMYDLSTKAVPEQQGTYAGIDAAMGEDAVAQTSLAQTSTGASDNAERSEKSVVYERQDSNPVQPCGCVDGRVQPHALGHGQILQFRLRRENVIQYMDSSHVSSNLKRLIPEIPHEPIYIFTASENGIMRFHPWGGIQRKLWHALGDSETTEGFTKNIAHAGKYGCFCFGVIYKERENYKDVFGKLQKGGRTIVMRYNRWATDNAPIYAMVRQHADERDVSIPAVPTLHGLHLADEKNSTDDNSVKFIIEQALPYFRDIWMDFNGFPTDPTAWVHCIQGDHETCKARNCRVTHLKDDDLSDQEVCIPLGAKAQSSDQDKMLAYRLLSRLKRIVDARAL